jgi:hypothetical protein
MNLHDVYLHEMVKRLPDVDEDPKRLEAIITEITLLNKHNANLSKSCDYIGVYKDYINLIELKGSYKPAQAKQQLLSTKPRVEDLFKRKVQDMKMVVYDNGLYHVHYM